jgi:tetratricopeptide (TPR) repeat protein
VDEPRQTPDVFISYTHADRAWAAWIAWELQAAGYTTGLQARDMPPGTAFAHAIDHAATTSRHTLLVLSPTYLRSATTEAGRRPGFVADPSGQSRSRRLVPVRVEPCQPEGVLADRVWIDLTGVDEATARQRLRDGIAAAERGHARPAPQPRFPRAPAPAVVDRPRFPTALPPVWGVPFPRNPAFTGREQILASLAAQHAGGGTAAGTQVLRGAGGVGKTAVAVEYTYRQRASFEVVWWVHAEQPATLVGDYTALAAALGLDQAGEADQQLVALAVRRWLEDHDRWLLVLDNAEGPDMATGLQVPLARLGDLLPQVVRGQVLVTSRDASWEQRAALAELEVFTPTEAAAFLLARSDSTDEQAAAQVAGLLGWLPLGLEQAGAYARQTRVGLRCYLERLQRVPTLTQARGRPRDRDPATTVATTWQVSLAQVQPIPGAVGVLEVCAFLAPDEVPRDLFAQALDPPAEELAGLAGVPFALDEVVAALRRYGLVTATEQTLSVHRLVQQVVRDHLDPPTQAGRVGVAVRLLAAAFPGKGLLADPGVWPQCAALLPHAVAAASHAERRQVEPEMTGYLLDHAASYLQARARYAEAQRLVERALELTDATGSSDHPTTAARLNNLATVLHAQGDLAHARGRLERALAIRENSLGPDHPDTATSLSNLAEVLHDQGDLDGARALHERALAIREAHLGLDHPTTARNLGNLAGVLYAQGDLQGARRLHERALAIHEAHPGADHPDTATSLGNLAGVLYAQGDLDGARARLERALAIREAHPGPDHPETARSLSNLAGVLHVQGDLDSTRTLYERALAIHEARLGKDHPTTATSLGNLAGVLYAQGDLQGARARLERALAIREPHLGADHPDTATSVSNLATVLCAQGDLDGARARLERALAVREARLGADHPDTVRSRAQLAAVMVELEDRQ